MSSTNLNAEALAHRAAKRARRKAIADAAKKATREVAKARNATFAALSDEDKVAKLDQASGASKATLTCSR